MTQTSAVDFSRYLPPGVYTNPMPGPQLVVNSTLPTAVALFGTTIGYRKFTESIYVEADQQLTVPAVSRTLAQKGIDLTTLVVTNPYTGAVFDENQDYTVVLVGGTQGTSEALYAVSRVIDGGTILSGDTVTVSYRYTDPDYFNPFVFYDYDDVRTAYGEPFNLTSETVNGVAPGGVLSELTLAAKFAFMNGAYQVVCVAVQPDDPESPVVAEYVAALEKLNDQALVALVVPCNGGMQPLNEQVRQHVVTQSANRFERRAIIGMDGSISSDQRRTYANQIGEQRIALVSPTKFTYYSPELNKSIELGGQYLAASLAGMTVSMSYAQPLTHKVITGWEGVVDLQKEQEKNDESKNGLMVIEKTRRQKMWVRHGVTTDPSDLLHREWNIIGQQDALVYRLRDYLENANLIGQPIYDYTLVNVKASAEAALQSLLRDGLLVNYSGLKARQLLTNPDVIEVSFSWLPAMPLNYIVVTFAVSLTSGSVTAQGNNPNNPNFTSNSQVGAITAPATPTVNDFGGSSNTLQSTL
jgi:hypothetical protein